MSDAISYRYTDNKPQLRSDKNNKLNGGLKYQLTVKTSNIRTYMLNYIDPLLVLETTLILKIIRKKSYDAYLRYLS